MLRSWRELPHPAWPALGTAALLLALSVPVLAQPSPAEIAALEQKVVAAPPADRSALLLSLSHTIEAVDVARALETARGARVAAQTPQDELMADARISTLLRQRGDYAEAITLARSGLDRAIDIGDAPAQAALHLSFARISWALGDYPPAIESYSQAIALGEKIGDRRVVARGHHGMALVYGEMGERMKARTEEQIALRIAEEIGDRELQADALNALGNNYYFLRDYTRAQEFHEQALALRTTLGLRRAIADSLVNLGEMARVQGHLPKASDYTERAIAIYEQLGLKRYLANAHLQSATILRDQRRFDEALARLQLGFAQVEALGSASLAANYHRELATLHEARGDWRAAFEAERKLAAANDTALGEKSRQQLAALSARYEAGRRQQEIALLRGERARQQAELRASESELDQANAMRLALGAAMLALAVVLGAIITVQRARLRAERRVLAQAKAAREAAEEADRMKTRFLGIASHDVRTPLANIESLVAELRARPAASTADREHLDLIGAEAQRVSALVQDLLDVAALESGRLELHRARIDLAAVVRDAVREHRWQAEAKRVMLTCVEPAPGTAIVDADAKRLHQVLTNLIGNAIKFTPPATTVAMAIAREGDRVVCSVRDEGPGLAAADVQRLFAPFTRLAAHPTAGESSHGLGLSIAHEIMRLHGGELRVETAPGAGATFFVVLQASGPQSGPGHPPEIALEAPSRA